MTYDLESSNQPTPPHSALHHPADASNNGNAESVHQPATETIVGRNSTDPHGENCDGQGDDITQLTEPAVVPGNPNETASPSSATESEASESECPFFASEDEFVQAVFDNWTYFARVLGAHYSYFVEQERETGNNAPVDARRHLPMDAPHPEERQFKVAIGSCDAEDIILDAIELCLKDPDLQSFYGKFTPICKGGRVSFRTWFCQRLRSKAGLRIKKSKCRQGFAAQLPRPSRSSQHDAPTMMATDRFLSQRQPVFVDTTHGADDTIDAVAEHVKEPGGAEATVESFLARGGRIRRIPDGTASNFSTDPEAAHDEEMLQWRLRTHAKKKRNQRKDPGYHPSYSRIEARLDVEKITSCLTSEEQRILDVRLDHDFAGREFATAIGYEYGPARNAASDIRKKMSKHRIGIDESAQQNDDDLNTEIL